MPKDPGSPADASSSGFSWFTTRARNVVVAAQNAARIARNAELTPEHLVLGMLDDPKSVACLAIAGQQVKLGQVKQASTALLPAAAAEPPEVAPYDPRARKVLELTLRQALRLGHNVGTEHLLLALLEAEDDTGVLQAAGVQPGVAERDITAFLDQLRI